MKVTKNNMTAYQEYFKGRAMLYRRGPWIAQALEGFQKAVILDPGYVQALAGVADAYTALSYFGYRRPEETMPTAIEAATRATVIEPMSGLEEIWTAFEVDPLSSYVSTVLSFALAGVGRFDEAVVHARAAVQQDPESFLGQWELGCAYHWNRQHEEAVAIHETLFSQSNHTWAAMGLVPACVRAGRAEQARGVYERLLTRQAAKYVQPFVLAVCPRIRATFTSFCISSEVGYSLHFNERNEWSRSPLRSMAGSARQASSPGYCSRIS